MKFFFVELFIDSCKTTTLQQQNSWCLDRYNGFLLLRVLRVMRQREKKKKTNNTFFRTNFACFSFFGEDDADRCLIRGDDGAGCGVGGCGGMYRLLFLTGVTSFSSSPSSSFSCSSSISDPRAVTPSPS